MQTHFGKLFLSSAVSVIYASMLIINQDVSYCALKRRRSDGAGFVKMLVFSLISTRRTSMIRFRLDHEQRVPLCLSVTTAVPTRGCEKWGRLHRASE